MIGLSGLETSDQLDVEELLKDTKCRGKYSIFSYVRSNIVVTTFKSLITCSVYVQIHVIQTIQNGRHLTTPLE